MRNSNKVYSVGTTVYYEGDEVISPAYGKITETQPSYLGELEFTVTLDDGRKITGVTPADFEDPDYAVFQMVDSSEARAFDKKEFDYSEGWFGLIGEVR